MIEQSSDDAIVRPPMDFIVVMRLPSYVGPVRFTG
jgi:hypothetical protein